jgi:curved DNA-binding protein
MPPDPYVTLGLPPSASADEIRRAYGRLADALRPTAAQDAADRERLAEIDAAFEVLGDANKRTAYDLEAMERDLAASERELDAFGPPSVAGDALADRAPDASVAPAFAPMPAQHATAGRGLRGSDWSIVLEVSLEDTIRGATVPATYALPQRTHDAADETQRTVDVHVPKLTRQGTTLLVKGKGMAGSDGGPPGDLHVEIVYRRHALFRVSGDDLWYHFPIAPWEGVLGAILDLPTLAEPFRVHVPAGTTSGQTYRLPGHGLPKAQGGRGDLLACLRIVTPQYPTEAERELYRRLAQVSRFNPRRALR